MDLPIQNLIQVQLSSVSYPAQNADIFIHYNTCMFTLLINLFLGIIGSYLINYLADVLPIKRQFVEPFCSRCHQERSWKSYLLLASCEHCQSRDIVRHLIVIIFGPILAIGIYFFPIENLGNYGTLLWIFYFGLVVIIDLEHRLILHPVSLVGAGLGVVFGIINHGVLDTLIGGAAGFGIMLAFYFLGEVFVRFLSQRRGEEIEEIALGFGDVNLAGIMGLLLGWPGVLGGLFVAILLGGLVSGLYLIVQTLRKKYQAYQALPYGPFLVVSVLILFYLSQIQ
jgi:leader peptidase (prepilin peptidase)/N-methyltransferase